MQQETHDAGGSAAGTSDLDALRGAVDAVDVLEQSAARLAAELAGMLVSVRATSSQLTEASVQHALLQRDAAEHVGEAVDLSVDKMGAFITQCVQLNQKLERLDELDRQLGRVKLGLTMLENTLGSTLLSAEKKNQKKSGSQDQEQQDHDQEDEGYE